MMKFASFKMIIFCSFEAQISKYFDLEMLHRQEIKIFKSFLIFTLVLEKYLEQNVSKMALLVNYQQHVYDKY